MKYCVKCVQPDTRPGIYFDQDGVCGACLWEEEKKNVDWHKRFDKLKQIAAGAKKKSRANYDCVIGVSGGKDSTFQALYSRDTLKLRPLLVNCEPEGITEIGRKNIDNLKQLGFDVLTIRPNPRVMKQLIKRDFYKYLNPVKPTEFPLYASSYIIAYQFKIPLIIQGENPGLTLGARNTGVGTDDDALKANLLNTLSTGWRDYVGNGVTAKDLYWFHYDRIRMTKEGYRGIWLGYYVKEWSPSHNAEFSMKHGLTIRPEYFNPQDFGTYSPYFQLDGDLTQVNQLLKYIKFGFGQCTDHAGYDIRDGLLTRQEAIELVKKYDGRCGFRYLKKFCDYIGITATEFWRQANKWRGTMWKKAGGKWVLKNPIWE